MADRLGWWVIPGALVVLARVVTLGPAVPQDDAVALDASLANDAVVLQDASGRRSAPVSWSALTGNALVVTVPRDLVGEEGTLTIWRRLDGQLEREPWLRFEAKVRDDATIPVAGLSAGAYDLRLTFAQGGTVRTFATQGATAPGAWVIAEPAATPAR